VLSQAAFPLGGDEAAQLSRSIEQAVAAEQEAAAAARDAGRAAAAAAEAAKQAVEKAERAAAAEQAAAERAAEERAAADRADAFRVAAEIAEAIFASEALDDVGRAGKVRPPPPPPPHTHTSPTRTGPCTFNAVELLSFSEGFFFRGLPGPFPTSFAFVAKSALPNPTLP